jgi:gliding motility-associated lipoprotein GldH
MSSFTKSLGTLSSRKNAKCFIWDRYILFTLIILITSCGSVDVFEKNVAIPDHEWSSSFKPEIDFEVTDTASLYNIYAVIRHTDAYRYNNMYMNVYFQVPGDTLRKERLDLRLATDDKGWLGTGMDDIFEHRILITREPQRLTKSGLYKFTLENLMREDPLQYVMNVGIRVEKVK